MRIRAATICAALLLPSSSTASVDAQAAPDNNIHVTFLGTGGGPAVSADFAGPSTLVQYGTESILIDAGRGLMQRMQQSNHSSASFVFLTHLHSDHTIGLPEFWLSTWWRGRRVPLEVRGPAGTKAMMEHLRQAWSYDIAIRS